MRSNSDESHVLEVQSEIEKEQEQISNMASDTNNDKKEATTLFQSFIRSKILLNEKKVIEQKEKEIDKKQESVIRNFYDGRRKKRSFTKIKGKFYINGLN